MSVQDAKRLETIIKRMIRSIPVSTGGNLLGFKLDIEPYLEKSGMFRNVHVKQTGDPQCALVTTCDVRDSALPASTVASVLQGVWVHDLAYAYWEAHHIATEDTSITLRFITTSGNRAEHLCVTGKIIASRPPTKIHTVSDEGG